MRSVTVLVANRGEIALRVFRTARRMGFRCVAVYSDADREAPFVRAADHAVRIGPAPASESYLRADRIVAAALEAGADLVHPGYGFLAEDASFARACEEAGLTFVGPPSAVLEAMGDKARAKEVAVDAGTPVLDGYAGDDQSDERFASEAGRIGYPVLVKPSAGGGGKGMAVVRTPDDLAQALAAARRVAGSAFGDETLLLERYLDHPRHVEVQILADAHGTVIHLGERDCSLQRRHQKILEEAPAPGLDDDVRRKLHEGAVALSARAGYVNAGTCEFLVGTAGDVGFIEMNARLQVEHPVTEMVTGLDLVELQLRVAMGERLPVRQDDVRTDGHAVEVRVYAEDPSEGFLPQAGTVAHLRWPEGARVDTGIEEGTEVGTLYDPMLAKLIVHGPSRDDALVGLGRALAGTELLGVRTNLHLLDAVARDPVVVAGDVTTTWLEQAYADWAPERADPQAELALAAAAELDRLLAAGRTEADPWTRTGPWRAAGATASRIVLRSAQDERTVVVAGTGPYRAGDRAIRRDTDCHGWIVDDHRAAAARDADTWHVQLRGSAQAEIRVGSAPRRLEEHGVAHLGAPMPGQVVAVRVGAGDRVTKGQDLVVVEAMKMEHAVRAPADGVVTAVLCEAGDQVDRGQPLVDVEPE